MTQPVFRRRGQALYFLQFASQVFVWPFLPLWLRRHVDGPLRLGSLLGACRAAQLAAAPAVTYAVEQAPRWLVLLGCWVASQLATVGLVAAANLRVGGFAALCALALARACAEAPITPMVDAIVVKATRDFSNARLWGAVAWGGLGPTAGLVFEFFGFTANVAAFGGLSAVAALLFFHLDAKMEPDDDLDDDIAQQSPQRGGATIEMRRSQKKATTKKRRPDLFPNPFKRAARLRKYESVPDLDDESDDEEEEVVEEPDEGGFARFENPFRRFNNRRRDDDDDEDDDDSTLDDGAVAAGGGAAPNESPRRENDEEDDDDEDACCCCVLSSSSAAGRNVKKRSEEEVFALLCERSSFLGRAGLLGAGFGFITNFLLIFIQDLGGGASIGGAALLVQSAVEVLAAGSADATIRRCGSRRVLDVVHVLYVLRFAGYALLDGADPLFVLAVEPLHGLSFALFYAAGVTRAAALFPDNPPFGQGLFAATFTAGTGLGAVLGGALLQYFAFHAAFAVFGIALLAALPVCSLLSCCLPGDDPTPGASGGGRGMATVDEEADDVP